MKVFKEKKNIHILNISSGIAINPLPGASLYGIGKSYLDYLTQVLNIESIGNLKATSFYPGSMNTVMRSSFIDKLNSDSELSHFDYSHLSDQVLSSPAKIAAIIIENFICTKKGWAKQVSKFYDYE